MGFDTATMRQQIDAAPGDRMAMEKDELLELLDVVDVAQDVDCGRPCSCRCCPPEAIAA